MDRTQLSDEFVRRLAAALRASQLYSAGHPIIGRNIAALGSALDVLHNSQPTVTLGFVGSEIVVGETPMGRADVLGDLVRRLRQGGVERFSIDRGISSDELTAFVLAIASLEPAALDAALPEFPHIRVGRIQIEQRVESSLTDMATIRRLYADAVAAAGQIWESAQTEHKPDAAVAKTMIDGLAHAVVQNRTALMALTALKQYDNYTFTHMVNVSILTMGQARALGIDGPLLREFGLSALMHDIGKVRTPTEVLNKPDKLTDAEFAIMKRHTVDGAEILRQTPDMPTLAPIVAFEHHLRSDGTGYPTGVARGRLNLGTMLCSIADVFDAMRSQRVYQKASPTDRILRVLKHSDGQQFDQHLVRRFVQLIGIYPAGNLVRLNTGDVAVVLEVHAPDPYKPRVRVLFDREGKRLELPIEISLWAARADGQPSAVSGPVDPADYQVDPLTLM